MLVTLTAILCSLATPAATPACVEEVITDTNQSEITFQQCALLGQHGVVEWMSHNPNYRTGWRVERWKCVVGVPERKA